MVVEKKKVKLPMRNFPTDWQTVIYRNYGFIPTERIAKTLECTPETVEKEAERLGLIGIEFNPEWLKSGYITLIRNNWYLLGMEQLAFLLGFSKEKLDYILKEEDFLFVKLGYIKPICPEIKYRPLSPEEISETEDVAAFLAPFGKDEGRPFDFFADFEDESLADTKEPPEGNRIVHGYLSPCGDVFMLDSETYLSDVLLEKYMRVGINGIWIHAVLSCLSPYPFAPALSENYRLRRQKMQTLIDRCAKYGIKIFLYFNEPRCLPVEAFEGREELMGHKENGRAALCSSRKEVKDYLYTAFYDFLKEVKGLGGIITITMSENLTHCQSMRDCNCEACSKTPKWFLAAEVNNIIMKAIRDSKNGCELIANLWAWAEYMNFGKDGAKKGIAALDKDISVLCVSEFDIKTEKGGVKSALTEYSISNVGPSDITRENLSYAKELGHKIYAKIQVNNSWEISCAPCLPAFDLVHEHLENLKEIGVGDYMLSWTLGGYPSDGLALVNAFARGESLNEWYGKKYGEEAGTVRAAVKEFCEAFKNYPVSIDVLYLSPKNLGYGNMWDIKPEKKVSTMVCYSFDDYKSWLPPYPYKVYLSQFEKMLSGWKKGIEILCAASGSAARRLLRYAEAAYCHLEADYLQTKYSKLKRDLTKNREELKKIVSAAEKGVKKSIELQKADATIGYEASNHYFYNVRLLKERALNLKKIKEALEVKD